MLARFLVRALQQGLLLVGILLLAAWLRNESEALAFQSVESARLARELQSRGPGHAVSRTVSEPRIIAHTAEAPTALGRVEIPEIHTSAMIAEGTDTEVLTRAVGHVANTAWVGQNGNVVLAGHRDTFFRRLGDLEKNDVVRVVSAKATQTYRVQWSGVVDPDRLDVLQPTATRCLTLITCYPFHALGPAPQRYVVRATAVPVATL